jgi:hypothetical protein
MSTSIPLPAVELGEGERQPDPARLQEGSRGLDGLLDDPRQNTTLHEGRPVRVDREGLTRGAHGRAHESLMVVLVAEVIVCALLRADPELEPAALGRRTVSGF